LAALLAEARETRRALKTAQARLASAEARKEPE
jgi:hypothetical protein